MTLIITGVSERFAVQVSDRRLTLPDGKLYYERANKALCVVCQDAHFSIAYTGLANIGNKRTDIWLVDELASMNVGSLTFTDLMNALKGKLEVVFKPLRILGNYRAMTLALAGFRPSGAFAGQLSNIEDNKACPLRQPSDEFHPHFWFPDTHQMRSLALFAHGTEQAVLQTDKKSLSKVGKRGLRTSPERTANLLVQIVRRAATHKKLGTRIGKNCMSVVISPQRGFTCKYHPIWKSPVAYAPHFIGQNIAFKDIYIASDRKPQTDKS